MLNIRFDPETLHRSKLGSITGTFSLNMDRIRFPSASWSDFVVVIVGWWIEALRSNDRTIQLSFMDGPYYLRVSRQAGPEALVECIESRGQDLVKGSFRIDILELRQKVEDVGIRILDACRERHWESKDLGTLAQLLDHPTRGSL